MAVLKAVPTSCFRRLKSTKSPYQKTVILPKTTFPLRRKNVAEFEKDLQKVCGFEDLYKWQWDSRKDEEKFVLHDGPPYANGDVHVGHAMNKILKDIIVRYNILDGKRVQYKPGWDCHGLPIETKAIRSDESFSLPALQVRKRARKFALQTLNKQKKVFKRWGVTADWKNSCYRTIDKSYQVTETRLFHQLYDKGLVFRDLKPVNWSPSSKTALAEGELEYNATHISRSAYFTLPLTDEAKVSLGMKATDDVRVLSWTTQPWTIPANKALGFASDTKYCIAKLDDDGESSCVYLLVAVDTLQRISAILSRPLRIVHTVEDEGLTGLRYTHPMRPDITGPMLAAPHATTAMGTGLVHLAPGHGAEDFALGRQHGLCVASCVDGEGRMNGEVDAFAHGELRGKFIFTEGVNLVLDHLRASGNLLHEHDYQHSYPYDWRSKKPIIIRTSKQWFIDTSPLTKLAQQACDQHIDFLSDNGKTSMLGHLSQRDFWCISRQRVWGLPIPTFYNKSTGEAVITPHTIEHVCDLYGRHDDGADVWWQADMKELLPHHVIAKSKLPGCSDDYRRGDDILDIWFDSGISWAAVLGEGSGVADLYLEGRDQYNGWFYSSLITYLAINNYNNHHNHHAMSPFKRLYTHGFALAGDGQKMSKSIGNVVDPVLVVEGGKDLRKDPAYGADVMRWWVAESNCFRDVRIGSEILKSAQFNIHKIRSSLRFMISNLNDFTLEDVELDVEKMKAVDIWFTKKVIKSAQQVQESYESYRFPSVAQNLLNIVNLLSRSYFAIIKDRLYCESKESEERRSAQTSLFVICELMMKMIAPILPHLVEELAMHHPCQEHHEGKGYFMRGKIPQLSMLLQRFNDETLVNHTHQQSKLEAVENLLKLRSKLVAVDSRPVSDYDVIITSDCEQMFSNVQKLHEGDGESNDGDVGFCEVREILGCSRVKLKMSGVTDDSESGGVALVKSSSLKASVNEAEMKPCPRCRLNVSHKAGQLCARCLTVLSQNWDDDSVTLFNS